jgi:hypothetical protein
MCSETLIEYRFKAHGTPQKRQFSERFSEHNGLGLSHLAPENRQAKNENLQESLAFSI